MNSRLSISLGALALAATMVATASAAGPKPKPVRPVIGQPVTSTTAAEAGDPFGVAFKVTRSDNRKPFIGAKATWTVAAGSSSVPHVTSFRGGVARVSLTVPDNATALRVTLTVKAGLTSTSKAATFPVTPLPSLSIGDVSAAEGNQAAPGKLSFPVALSRASHNTVTVAYATADGTATTPADYAAATGTLTFAPGETQKAVDVSVVGDVAAEPDETLTLKLSNPIKATIAKDTATGTVANDDVAPKAGHYNGRGQKNVLLDFDVTNDLQVTNATMSVDMSCDGHPTHASARLGRQVLAVDPATGNFGFNYATDYESLVLTGTLEAPDKASGEASGSVKFYYLGQLVQCDFSSAWSASLTS